MKKILICILACLLMGCGTTEKKADMSEYEGFGSTEHIFYESTMKDIDKKIKNKDTLVVYFGFAKCPWCIEAMPILNEIGQEYSQKIYYVNTRKNPEWSSNIDIDDYDLFVEDFGEYVPYDEDGIKHLYTPHVFFVKQGEVVSEHSSTVDDHDATERKMTDEEIGILKEYYIQGFKSLE